ncbi:MAG TPA: AsmA family protein [Steroidobacteraceae bacterium]|nr:AsmA family protein [Steroidobacteraceae bacterium]
MTGVSAWRRGLKWAIGAFLALVALALLLGVALDAGYLQGPLVKILAARALREIRVDGGLRLHLFSRNPRLVAERVTIGNPPWTPPGVAVLADKISVVFETPRLGRFFEIASLDIVGATLHMFRDVPGHANWQLKNPDKAMSPGLPIIHSLSVVDAHLFIEDAQKNRQFDGTLTAQDSNGPHGTKPLRIEARGQLNGRPVNFELLGDPLRTASRSEPYGFALTERSSGSHIAAKGALKEFDLLNLDASFEASGADLRDIYYLMGVKLIDTGAYRLSGKFSRRGNTASYSDLAVTFGQSDIRGSVSIALNKGLPGIDADLISQSLRVADLGARAAGREPEPESPQPMLLSNAAPNADALRPMTAILRYRARRLAVGRFTLSTVAAKVTVDRGLLAVTPLSADVLDGKLTAQLKIDARKEIPAVDLDVKITDLQLGQYARKGGGPPAIEGPLDVRAKLTGRGKSMHEAAASAEGTVTATLPRGTVRDSFAELTGIDLRGLGLLLTKSTKEVPIRCGVASFQAHDGTLTASSLLLDTEPVLIAGEGVVHLGTENLDFVLRGYPKSVRFFQLRSPILIGGTLMHPSVGIQAHDSKLVLVDRGKAKDTDCEPLLR